MRASQQNLLQSAGVRDCRWYQIKALALEELYPLGWWFPCGDEHTRTKRAMGELAFRMISAREGMLGLQERKIHTSFLSAVRCGGDGLEPVDF